MRPFDGKLADLNRRWSELVVNGGDPGIDPAQRVSLLCWSVVGTVDQVVPRASAAGLASFSTIEYVPKGHIELVKARDRNDPTYAVIARFIREAERTSRQREGERAVEKLTFRLREASLAGRWVVDEEETIKLEATAEPSRLKCSVTNVRRGGLAARTFNVGVWLTGYRPAGTIDYEWEIGQGILTKEDYARLTGAAAASFAGFFEVDSIRFRQGRDGEFVAKGSTKGAASVVLHYEAPDWFREDEPVETLTLKLNGLIDRGQGWMFYASTRTVLRSLEVSLEAPFDYGIIPSMGKGAKVNGPTPTGATYISKVTGAGPLAIGRTVIWVFRR